VPLDAFTLVLVAGRLINRGAFNDAYKGSVAEKIDQDSNEVASCRRGLLWSSMNIE
jgi:hypothetical protein